MTRLILALRVSSFVLRRRRASALLFSLFSFLALAAGCSKLKPVDTRPLEQAGMAYSTVKELRELNITESEVAELSRARAGGVSDRTCVEMLRLARSRNLPFTSGDAAARLAHAEISEPSILELARADQLGLSVGEIELMHLAGISEETIMVVARRRAQNLPVMSGASIAQLKNAGMSEGAVRELARRGVNDNEAKIAFSMRRHGVRDAEILRHIPGR